MRARTTSKYASQRDPSWCKDKIGNRWQHSLDVHAGQGESGDVLVYREDGRIDNFTLNLDDSYTSPPGVHDTLVLNQDDTFTLTLQDQTVQNLAPLDDGGRLQTIAPG